MSASSCRFFGTLRMLSYRFPCAKTRLQRWCCPDALNVTNLVVESVHQAEADLVQAMDHARSATSDKPFSWTGPQNDPLECAKTHFY